jgi:hypothetical protein
MLGREGDLTGMDLFGWREKIMIDQLINLVKQSAGDEIERNPAIPNEQNGEAMREVGNEISSGLEREAKQGNVQNLVAMFKGNTSGGLTSNPMIQSIVAGVASKLGAKFGVSPEKANQIASAIVPKVLNQFINKTNDPNDKEFDLQDVLKNLTGNSNIGDLMSQFSGSQKGGLGEAIGGMFGNKK